jgi:hypothetical protein
MCHNPAFGMSEEREKRMSDERQPLPEDVSEITQAQQSGPSPWLNGILVEGLSGAGKSSAHEELIRRGYEAINTDRAWAYHADSDTGLPGWRIHHDNFIWDQQKLSANSKPGTRGVICLWKQPSSRLLSALFHQDIQSPHRR